MVIGAGSPTLRAARDEVARGLRGMLGADVPLVDAVSRDGALVAGTPSGSPAIAALGLGADLGKVGDEGFLVRATTIAGKRATVVAANTDVGVLYGVFRLLQRLQAGHPVDASSVVEAPRIRHRVLNHWDNLDRTVERGYAGFSLWDWHKLPDYVDPRITDYARANASIGINGTVLTNVNANATSLLARVPREGGGPGAGAPALRHPGLPHRAVQRPGRDRRAEDGRSPRPARSRPGGSARPTRSTRSSPTSGASWSRPTPRASPGRRTTAAPTPTARTCWPTRSPRTAAS